MLTRFRRDAGLALLLFLVVVALSGCLKLDLEATVSEDNTISGTMVFGFDKALLESMGQSPEDALSGSEPLPEDLEGVTQSDYDDGKYVGYEYTFDSLPLEEWNTSDTDIRIEREGDEFVVSGTMDLSTGAAETGDPAMDEQLTSAFESAELRIALTFPGEVTESNGEVSGNTVTWEPKFGETTDLEATASAVGGGGGMTMWLIIGAVVLIVVIIVIVVLATRKGGSAAPGAPAEGAGFDAPAPAAPAAPEATIAPEASAAPPTPEAPPAPEAPEAPPAPDVPDAPSDN